MSSRKVVVVGGGVATVRLVQELRTAEPAAHVTVVAAEEHQPYDRPPLSKGVLRGEGRDPTFPMDWTGVDLLLGRRAVSLNPADRTVRLEDGSALDYDDAVIATGAQPRTLGRLAGSGVHVLRTLDDARALSDDIRRIGRLTVVGAGFIGSEVAASARAMGAEVTLIEALPTPLAGVLGQQVGAEVAALHQAHGVHLRCNTTVVDARGAADDRELILSDGDVLSAPVVAVGLGVHPDTGWLASAGLDIDDGVVCDATGRTSMERVWAAGDVARWWHPLYQASLRLEHWTSAADQGATVAHALTGDLEPLGAVPYFWSDQHGAKMQMLGRPGPEDDVTVLQVGPAQDRLVAVYGRKGLATAVFGLGAARWVMRARSLLLEGASVENTVESITAEQPPG